MELLHLTDDVGAHEDAVIVLSLDGWTDAGQAGTTAAAQLREQLPTRRIGWFDPDGLFDYRDRRPILTIDEGELGSPSWPELAVYRLDPDHGPTMFMITGAEPDLSWQALCRDVVKLAEKAGASRYVGLGSVPAPAPHTRPVRVIATGSDVATIEAIGRPHERVVVPASCQVVVETALRDAGLETVGLWARVPHYVGGEYPEGAQAILDRFRVHLGVALDLTRLDEEAKQQRSRLDVAAQGSDDVRAHIAQLEEFYDADAGAVRLDGPLPTGDEIAADFERFLREQDD
ncbi:MAG: PAC2 family protein [Nitriliruptorales bacterium]|nr:PAC2 family protein [Nitriliruptorales bacterium]